jgi:lipopolysaccharide/colanic/teichoic acid biosynthesis glycosyltransferase
MRNKFKVEEFETFEDFRISTTKRIFDLIFSSIMLIILSPFLLILGLLICIDSKGPAIYVSKRVDTGYDIFNFYKFRLIYLGSDKKELNYPN